MARLLAVTTLVALAAFLSLAGPARADPDPLSAPLGLGTPGPLRQLFLDPAAADARAVRSAALAVRLEDVNSWSVPTALERDGRVVNVQLDSQSDALVLSARLPWGQRFGDRVATTAGWRVTGFWGGFEDGGIEAWHGLVNAYNSLRERYPRDHLELRLTEEGGATAFDLQGGNRISAGDLVIGHQVLLASGGKSVVAGSPSDESRWGLAVRLDLKVPVGSLSRLGGSGGPDAGLSLLVSRELTPWAVLHGHAFVTATSPMAAPVALQPRTLHHGLELSLALLLGRDWALVLEDRWVSALMEGGFTVLDGGDNAVHISSAAPALFRPHNQLSGGLRRGRFTLGFSEDFTLGDNPRGARGWFYSSNSPDTVVTVGYVVPL